jgi:crotonobetainyl-CoA:carnitine CoA-transferase CaiB-like acyl-CoA transferase
MFSFFQDLKVVELASVLAGPSVGMFFAELGCDVKKVEHPSGDMTRKWKLPKESKDANISGYYCSVNWGKEVHLLNLKDPEDNKKVREWIADADILISNFKYGDADKFNLTYQSLKDSNPRLIYSHLSGYGSDVPRAAFDVVIQAEAGFMHMNGQNDGPPTKMPVALMDVLAAHQMKEGILCALLEREKTGKGGLIEASLIDSGIASLANQATNYLMGDSIPTKKGSIHPNIAPYGEYFECKDGKLIVLAVGTDKQFKLLCEILASAETANDERFTNNQSRVSNRQALDEALSPAFLKKTSNDWNALFIEANVPAGIVRSMDEVFKNQSAQDLILNEEVDGVETKRVKSVVFKYCK